MARNLKKGSPEAKEWAAKMRAAQMSKATAKPGAKPVREDPDPALIGLAVSGRVQKPTVEYLGRCSECSAQIPKDHDGYCPNCRDVIEG